MANQSKLAQSSHRKVIVFVSLVGVLTATSALLLALSPAPLRPEAAAALFNADTTPADPMEAVFQTDQPIRVGRWTSILIHSSGTPAGDTRTLAHGQTDHFILCNGEGGSNGEIQLTSRWVQQNSAGSLNRSVGRDTISICLVGDFRKEPPTVAQVQRLQQLVTALEQRLAISIDRVRFPELPRWR